MITRFLAELFCLATVTVEKNVPASVAKPDNNAVDSNMRTRTVVSLLWNWDPIFLATLAAFICPAVLLLIMNPGSFLVISFIAGVIYSIAILWSKAVFRIGWLYVILAVGLAICMKEFSLGFLWISADILYVIVAPLAFYVIKKKEVFVRVAADELGVRELLSTTYFTNCVVFSPDSLTRLTKIPGSQESFYTPDSTAVVNGQPHPDQITVQVPQGETDEMDITRKVKIPIKIRKRSSDEQLIVLQIFFHLAIFKQPWVVIAAYLDEFRCKKGENHKQAMDRAIRGKVTADIMRAVKGIADEVLQQYHIEQLLTNSAGINPILQKAFEKRLDRIGVTFDLVTIEDVKDVRPGGYVESRSSAMRTEQQTLARIRQAVADRKALISELERDRLVAVEEVSTLEQLEKTERQRAVVALQELKALADQDIELATIVAKKLFDLDAADAAKIVGALGANVSLVSLDGFGAILESFRNLAKPPAPAAA